MSNWNPWLEKYCQVLKNCLKNIWQSFNSRNFITLLVVTCLLCILYCLTCSDMLYKCYVNPPLRRTSSHVLFHTIAGLTVESHYIFRCRRFHPVAADIHNTWRLISFPSPNWMFLRIRVHESVCPTRQSVILWLNP